MSQQYLRQISLFVGVGGSGLELAPAGADQLSIRFSIQQRDFQTPNRCQIRVRNLSEKTVRQIQQEFTQVILQAGYDGNFGVIFAGTIVQVRRGRENAVDSYLDIVGAEGDEAHNQAVVSATLAAGSTAQQRMQALANAMAGFKVSLGAVPDLPATQLPRGKVMFGMARDHLRDQALSNDVYWSLKGTPSGYALNLIALNGYLPGEAVSLNSQTGLIGFPEQTQQGIKVRSLLNPRFQVGTRVQIDNASIQQMPLSIGLSGVQENAFLPQITDDGIYRILVCEHEGETRGNDWHSNLLCCAVNEATPPSIAKRGYS